MKKIRKNKQFSLMNYKGAGRPTIHDIGIRHTSRPHLHRPSSLHLTVKVRKIKADIKNKTILLILKRSILNARRHGLKVIHYSLEYDHVHLLIEADNNAILGKGMKAFGVTLAKAVNKVRKLKNVMRYIFLNGVKHGTSKDVVNAFNSIRAEERFYLFYKGAIEFDWVLMSCLDRGKIFFRQLDYL